MKLVEKDLYDKERLAEMDECLNEGAGFDINQLESQSGETCEFACSTSNGLYFFNVRSNLKESIEMKSSPAAKGF